MTRKECNVTCFKLFSQNLPGRSEENPGNVTRITDTQDKNRTDHTARKNY